MRLAPALSLAWASLKAHKLRSALTMLGVIIGVLSVVTMVSIGRGASEMIDQSVRAMGTNILVLSSGFSRSGPVTTTDGGAVLTDRDAVQIARQIPEVMVAAPIRQGGVRLVADGVNWGTQLQGVTRDILVARDWSVAEGRFFTDAEIRSGAKVAVIGQTVARELFAGQSPVGRTVRANRVPVQIVGVLASKGQNAVGFDQDDITMVPLKTAQSRLVGGNRRSVTGEVNQIVIKAVSASALPAAERQVDQFLRAKFRLGPDEPPTYSLRNISQLVALRTQTTRVMTSLLAGIAAVSLIVGGIGIMNIMLVSVTERTREIGLRMAVGARPGDVRLQFLTEAAMLSLIGGAVGVLLAIPATAAAARAFELPAPLDLQIVIIALGFSALVGLLFGWVPARRASKLDPIEALRHD